MPGRVTTSSGFIHAVVESSTAEALIEASADAGLLVIGRGSKSPGRSSARAANHDVLLNMASPVLVVLA